MSVAELVGWDRLRHGGLLLDALRIQRVAVHVPDPLPFQCERELRQLAIAMVDPSANAPDFVTFVFEKVCGFGPPNGAWRRGSQVGSEWGRCAVTGETIKPRQLWCGDNGAILPVFFDTEARLGIGRGRKNASQTVQWLRAGSERLAVLTNGRQWRLVFAGLDFDAWCEWDIDLWFEGGGLSPQVNALRTLLSPTLWTPPTQDTPCPLLEAILDSRKGQAELSAVLGERVREAVELLVQGHGEVLKERCSDVAPADIYRAAVRVVMRMVVVLFAESRELLPRDNALYHGAYGLTGLLEDLEKVGARGGSRLARSWNAWPRVLALFRLVYQGSHHPALPVSAYGGELFAPGVAASVDGLARALAIFETACFERELLSDREVHRMLERITRTRVKVRQGRSNTWVPAPVDFSDLSSEYIGILYEGVLDFELKTAPPGDPVVFLAVGNQPALPLSDLEAMEDRALANLLEKMQDTSEGHDEAEATEDAEDVDDEAGAEDQASEGEASPEELDADAIDDGDEDGNDERHTTRTRAESWARRAVEVGKLARKPKTPMTPEKRLAYDDAVARKARRLVTRVILPGEWYLVRWGGTRKGAGTFYTRPGLAVPTVQRTLRPLAYTPPTASDGAPDLDAPHTAWTPKSPEEILALKICDPACGSGTFPVVALRFLTEALFASLHHHGRVSADGDRAVVRVLAGAAEGEDRLGQELLPCRPDDPYFEPNLKAVLRRHVVERCIYGVDLDPLAVELCRLALWVETMDRALPFSFLDHKVKCGNSLVGSWFDEFQHYPVMAWKNREGGDRNHAAGVHFHKGARTDAIKAFVEERLAPDLRHFLEGPTLFETEDLREAAVAAHTGALATLSRLHGLPVHDANERARIYRDELLRSEAYTRLKEAMDLWCGCWFWPVEALDYAPLPTSFHRPSENVRVVAARVAVDKRFFHWELEFPDVFCIQGSGFDAILGNPPWDTLQANSKEYFSNLDPLYRSYGKQEALNYQAQYFVDKTVERDWLDYNSGFASYSQWMRYAWSPFGDPRVAQRSEERFTIARGNAGTEAHDRWRSVRARSFRVADPNHPFRYRGEGKSYTYKLFLELAYSILREGGRMGFIVPSGLYSDDGTSALRHLLFDGCNLEWVFNFENREAIFDIHRSFKFNPIIFQRGGTTSSIHFAANRRKVEDWVEAERWAINYTRVHVSAFSPKARALLEATSPHDLDLLTKIYANCILLGTTTSDKWGVRYRQGDFNLTSASRLFMNAESWFRRGILPNKRGCWRDGDQDALPLYEGKMIWQFDFAFSAYDYGGSRRWRKQGWKVKHIHPRHLVPTSNYVGSPGIKLVVRDVSSPSNRRTVIAACIPDVPCGHKTPILRDSRASWEETLAIATVLNSLCFDYVTRLRFAPSGGGGSLVWSLLSELPIWRLGEGRSYLVEVLRDLALELLGDWTVFAPVAAARFAKGHSDLRLAPAVDSSRRLELRCIADAINFYAYGLTLEDVRWILRDCDHPMSRIQERDFQQSLGTKLFWRVDKEEHPECRQTVLAFVAYKDLLARIAAAESNPSLVVRRFGSPVEGGWRLPDELTLTEYGLGHDDRAQHPQPVRSAIAQNCRPTPDMYVDWRSSVSLAAADHYGKDWMNRLSQPGNRDGIVAQSSSQDDLFRDTAAVIGAKAAKRGRKKA